MKLIVNGHETYVANGGRTFDPSLPVVVMIHGAGFDHSTWALHTRWFAHNGFAVLAPDLPGHGRSHGDALTTIADLADWTAALIDASGAKTARLIGHSMGSLIALETAARHPAKITRLDLMGTAGTMTVGPDLLKDAEANLHSAIDMVSIWDSAFVPNSAAASRRGCGCIAVRSVCSRPRSPAFYSPISTPAIHTRTRWLLRRSSTSP